MVIQRIKITIYRNFEANILTSKHRFHKLWNFNPSSDIIIAFMSKFWIDDVTTLSQNFKILREQLPQRTFYSWFSSFYHHWYMKYQFGLFLTHFWIDDVTTRSQNLKFWDSGLTNEYFTSSFPLLLTFIFQSFVNEIQLWALFDPILG